ncbi:MAG: D-alanine--D-alanine ligase [Rickettsiaceae bacterium H1]|nr:D-alanine--D-alanine ligase [Rickettsiaceae bacterium H1]
MNILLICGGQSHEHDISLKSAQFILTNANKEHAINILVIGKDGNCTIKNRESKILGVCNLGCIQIKKDSNFICKVGNHEFKFNAVFPIIHGPLGEDGTLQGWLELLKIPYVGCKVISSAISMDKDIAKRLVKNLGIDVHDYIIIEKKNWNEINLQDIKYPLFVKSANSGSSIGVYKVKTKNELLLAIEEAFHYDEKILLEQSVENSREIEVAVLEDENNNLIISMPGEVVVKKHEFYSYEAKYTDPKGAELLIPAPLTTEQNNLIKTNARKIFMSLRCSGMARIDFLLQEKKLFFNEINTIPGFTDISLYPNLLKASGIEFSRLINILLKNAINKK